MKKREKLLSLTSKDFVWEYKTGSGSGGQHRNRKKNTVVCKHIESGAVAIAGDQRSQAQNKKTAFMRLANSEKFKKWLRIESARQTGAFLEIEKQIDRELKNPKITKIEYIAKN